MGEIAATASESASDIDRELSSGDRAGEYQIVRPIGRGGFGCVYEAVQPIIDKRVAVKVLSRRYASGPTNIDRFIREARAANAIHHPGIIDVFAFGTLDDGRPYYVMELLEGKTLAELLEERDRLPLAEVLELLEQIAVALDAAHAEGVLHRDLKPANVFLLDGESSTRVKLLDFGLAKLLDSGEPEVSGEGALIGTPHYMSPEQCRGRKVDRRADIYSLGVLAFRVLTGQYPFTADDPLGILVQHAGDEPPLASSVRSDLPRHVDLAISQMLKKDPEARPESAAQAVELLAGPAPTPRSRWVGVAIGMVVLAIVAIAASTLRSKPAATVTAATTPTQASFGPTPKATSSSLPIPSSAPSASGRERSPVPRSGPPKAPGLEDVDDPFAKKR